MNNMKLIRIIIFLLLVVSIELFPQLLQTPCVAYRVDRMWYIADEMGNTLYSSTIMLDVENLNIWIFSGIPSQNAKIGEALHEFSECA